MQLWPPFGQNKRQIIKMDVSKAKNTVISNIGRGRCKNRINKLELPCSGHVLARYTDRVGDIKWIRSSCLAQVDYIQLRSSLNKIDYIKLI